MPDFARLPLAEPWFLLVLAGALCAGIVRGLSGFGSALIIVPLLNIYFGPAVAAPVIALIDPALTLPLLPAAFRRCDWREVAPVTLAAVAAVPFGALILIFVEGDILRRAIALLILAFIAAMASGWRYRGRGGLALNLAIGAVAGAMCGAIGVAGPPVILFWLGGAAGIATARANVIVFFGAIDLATIIVYGVGHLFSAEVAALAIVLAPVFGLGVLLGARAFALVSERVFRIVSLGLIGLVALASLLA